MKYMCLIYEDSSVQLDDAEREQLVKEYWTFIEEVVGAGKFVGGDALEAPATATTVRLRSGQTLTTDGPFAETKEFLGGYYILECADLDEAWAAKIPSARTDSIEVRPVATWVDGVTDPAAAVEAVAREEWGRVTPRWCANSATLSSPRTHSRMRSSPPSRPGRSAASRPARGVAACDRPPQVARPRPPQSQLSGKLGTLAAEPLAPPPPAPETVDDELKLLFLCCHPALAQETQSPSAACVASRRRRSRVPSSCPKRRWPSDWSGPSARSASPASLRRPGRRPPARPLGRGAGRHLPVFNEGHPATEGRRLVRDDLCQEAIRLGRMLVRLLPHEPEVRSLLALLLFTDARRPARTDTAGDLVLLDDQDRSQWDRQAIEDGAALLPATRPNSPGPYQVQAEIAFVHASAPTGPPPTGAGSPASTPSCRR